MAFTDGTYFPPNFSPAKAPKIPTKPLRVEHTVNISAAPAKGTGPSPAKICLSIDIDTSLGHLVRESYGDRLLVDKEQARKLVAVLCDYLGEPPSPDRAALTGLQQYIRDMLADIHCSELEELRSRGKK